MKIGRFRLVSQCLIPIALCCASVCFAQTDHGNITGTVMDPKGLVVPGASVTATNLAMGTQYPTVSTSAGLYAFPELPAGVYSVTVVAPGFSTLVRSGITVSVSQTSQVDLTLKVGATSATVTVTTDAPLLETDNPQNDVIVTSQDMNELPINIGSVGAIRDPLMFAALAAGTEVNVNGNSWNDIHINGAPGWTFQILMDGMSSTSPVSTRVSDEAQTSVEAIGEFSLQQNSYSAEFGGSLGGVYNMTAKSGSNKFHGSLFNYLQNDSFLNAGQPFNYDANNHNYVPFDKQEDFGGSFGGPVVIPHFFNGHNRTFFFFAYEQYHDAESYNYGTMTVPTTAYRNGDLSFRYTEQGAPIQVHRVNPDGSEGPLAIDCLGRPVYEYAVYDPSTTRLATCVSTSNGNAPGSVVDVRDPFPNNFIGSPGTWDPVAQKVLSLTPTPSGATASAPYNNYPYIVPGNKFQYLPSIRGDQKISDKFHIYGFFSNEKTNKDNWGSGFPGAIDTLRWMTIHGLLAYAGGDYAISPHLEVHGGLGYHRHDSPQSAADLNVDQATLLGLPSQTNLPGYHAPTFPYIAGLSVNGAGVNEMGSDTNNLVDNNYQAVGSVTWIHGAHDFKFGGDIRLEAFANNAYGSSGSYNFSTDQTGLPSEDSQTTYEGANLGDGFASFALGQLQSAQIAAAPFPWWVRRSGSIFGQDTWKLTRNLTVSYGLRWDFLTQDHEERQREIAFSPTVANENAGGLPGGTIYEGSGTGRCNCSFEAFYPWMIQPRLGFLYQPDSKTVVHVSSGIYSGQLSWAGMNTPPFQGFGWNTAYLNQPGPGLPAGQFSTGFTAPELANIDATDFDPGAFTSAGSIQSPGGSMVYPGNKGRPPQMVQTDVGVERELMKDLTVDLSWVDIRGTRLEADNLVNGALNGLSPAKISSVGLDPTNVNDINFLNEPISSPDVQAKGFTAPYAGFPSQASLAQALRPFPQFGGLGYVYANVGNWWYDSAQFKVTKRMSHGLTVMANYTWSKDLGTADNSSEVNNSGAVPIQNAFLPPKSQKTYMSIDLPQMLKFEFREEIPTFGFASSGWKRAVFKGWTTDGIFSYQSGFVMPVPGASSLQPPTFQAEAGIFMNRVPGQSLFLHSLNDHNVNPWDTFYLNPNAWVNPCDGCYGSGKPFYNDFRGPRYPNEQAGVGKVIDIGEGVKFSFRADFFNLFNRWALPGLNIGSPNATPQVVDGVIQSGFGYIGASLPGEGSNYPPRNGEIVARIEF